MLNYSIRETPAQRAKWAKCIEEMKAFRLAVAAAALKAGIVIDLDTDQNALVIPCADADDIGGLRAISRVRGFWDSYKAKYKPSIKGLGGAYYGTANGKGAVDDSGVAGWRVTLRY